MNNIFEKRRQTNSKTHVPVWFMRQAGRYHDHYQNMKKTNTFVELCKTPKLAQEVTHGPMDEFGFDAAILFSDLLFPLEHLGSGLEYSPGPKLSFKYSTLESLDSIKMKGTPAEFYDFQKQACTLLRQSLDSSKTLLGFVGAPFTLYAYLVEGSHAGSLVDSKKGLYDGRFEKLMEVMLPSVIEEAKLQLEGGADSMCVFDTAVGELCLKDYKQFILPYLHKMIKEIKTAYPDKQIIYYSRNTHVNYLNELDSDLIDVIGVDWRHTLPEVFEQFSDRFYIQGNFDPCWLHLPWDQLKENLDGLKASMESQKGSWNKWIFGLGHGVLQHTPTENVKNTVKWVHENLTY